MSPKAELILLPCSQQEGKLTRQTQELIAETLEAADMIRISEARQQLISSIVLIALICQFLNIERYYRARTLNLVCSLVLGKLRRAGACHQIIDKQNLLLSLRTSNGGNGFNAEKDPGDSHER